MFQKLKQIKDLRDQAKQVKSVLDDIVVVGSGARGVVMVTLNGSHEVLGVELTEGTPKADLERGVKEAFADANKKLQQELATRMRQGGDLGNLGDLMKGIG